MFTTTDTCAMTLAQKSDRILAQTRGLSGATPNATRLIEELRWALEANRNDVQRLTAERDEARAQEERWEDDALRLMKERNAAQEERDEARRAYCIASWRLLPDEQAVVTTPVMIAQQHGWNWRSWAPFKEQA